MVLFVNYDDIKKEIVGKVEELRGKRPFRERSLQDKSSQENSRDVSLKHLIQEEKQVHWFYS